MYINKVTLIGNLGLDPEIKTFSNGGKFAVLLLATQRYHRQDNEYKLITQWHKIAVFNRYILENKIEKGLFKKGTKLYIEGEILYKEFADKATGAKMKSTEIVVNNNHDIKIFKSSQTEEEQSKQTEEESELEDMPF